MGVKEKDTNDEHKRTGICLVSSLFPKFTTSYLPSAPRLFLV